MRKVLFIALVAVLAAPAAAGGPEAALREYRDRAKRVAPDDVKGHYVLGLWCRQRKLAEQARLEFERVIALEPDHAGARTALGYVRQGDRWLTGDEAMRARGLVRHARTWMLPEELQRLLLPAREKERLKREQERVRKLLRAMNAGGPKVQRIAMKALDGIEDRYKVDPLAYALRYPSEPVRIYAARELGRIRDRRTLRPLVFRSLVDPSEAVRETALAAAKGFGDPNLLAPYVNALFSENAALRTNAARNIGDLGDVRGIEYLVYRLSAHGGGLTRSHIYLAKQISFIQDYDVEVAQTAFIADPMVGVLQEGQVLDVRVIATERNATLVERRVVRSALARLAGVDLGDKPAAWAKWWKEHKEELLARKR